MKTFTTAFALSLLCSSVFASGPDGHDSSFARRDAHAQLIAKRAAKRQIVPAGALLLAPSGYKAPSVSKLGANTSRNATTVPAKAAVKASTKSTKPNPRSYAGSASVYTLGNSPGLCKKQYKNTDLVIALPSQLYNSSSVSSYCGQRVVVTNSANRKRVAALVSTNSKTQGAKLSRGLFAALGGKKGGQTMEISFALSAVSATTPKPTTTAAPTSTTSSANAKSLAMAKSAQAKIVAASASASSSSAAAAASSQSQAAAAASSSSAAAAAASQQAQAKKVAQQEAADAEAAKQQAEKEAAEKAAAEKAAAEQAAAEKAAADKAAADKAAAEQQAAEKAAADKAAADQAAADQKAQEEKEKEEKENQNSGGGNGNGQVYTGGFATYYMQNGNPGNCGSVASDSDKVIALPTATYAGGSHCGQQIRLTRTDNGKSVTATVRDSCPTCVNNESLDLSVGAFTAIAEESEGMVPISWVWA